MHADTRSTEELEALRAEADMLAEEAGTACVRHIRRRSRIFSDLAVSDELLRLIPSGLRPVRSILFDKTEDENWPVPWHQDLTITVRERADVSGYGPWSMKDGSPHVQPPLHVLEGMATIRLHLDDTPKENGALSVIPNSHKVGKLNAGDVKNYPKDDVVDCACKAGDILIMSPLILHSSKRSVIPNRRRVIHFEYARDEDLDKRLDLSLIHI